MEYKEIKLNVSNNKIREYKQFEGMKLYSDFFKSEDGRKLTNKRVYVTRKQNYVYYERTDVNWNYWSNKDSYNSDFIPDNVEHDICLIEYSNLRNSKSKRFAVFCCSIFKKSFINK